MNKKSLFIAFMTLLISALVFLYVALMIIVSQKASSEGVGGGANSSIPFDFGLV